MRRLISRFGWRLSGTYGIGQGIGEIWEGDRTI